MPQPDSHPALSKEARKAISEVLEAISTWHTEMAATSTQNNEKVLAKMSAAAEALGWPRQIVDALLEILKQVKIKPYLMDIKPLALARLVKDNMAIIVDIQPYNFDIVIMADGIPQPVRTVSFPEEDLSRQTNCQ